MVIYGTKATELLKEVSSCACPNCGTQNSLELHVIQKYAHIFWIPIFPLGKRGVSQCGHCKQVLKQKEMPEALKLDYANAKPKTKTPVWTFSGLALLAILIAIAVVNDKQKTEKNAKLILAPQSGDVFRIKTKENQYTLYKVAEMDGDSALIRINQFETNKISGLADLKAKGETAWSEEVYPFAKTELKAMLDNGEIIDIER